MKKILLSTILLLSFAIAKPVGFGDALKYVDALSALESALKGNQQGFADLINLATGELENIDFSALTANHIGNIVSLAKVAMNSNNSQIKTAAKGFINKLIPQIQKLASKSPGTFLPLLGRLQSLIDGGSGLPMVGM